VTKNLPKGWSWTTIYELSSLVTKGATPTTYGYKYQKKGILFVKVENIADYSINHNNLIHHISEEAHLFLKRSQLKTNDILFSIAGTIGRTCLVHTQDIPANINQALAIIRIPWSSIDKKFLLFYLDTYTAKKMSELGMRGVGMNNISLGNVKSIPVTLCPENEQKRIVKKIEILFDRLNKTKKELAKIPPLIKKFRQSVLAKAFNGELTKEWREKQKDLEPASILLERIRTERKKQLGKKYKEPEPIDTSNLLELPEGWEWATISEITLPEKDSMVDGPFGSDLKVSEYTNRGVPLIRLQNIERFHFKPENLRFISPKKADELARHSFKPGDIVITKLGKPLGKSCIIPIDQKPGIFVADIVRVRPNIKEFDREYLVFAINSFIAQLQFSSLTKGTTRPRVNLKQMREINIPIAPFEEQKHIVEKIKKILSFIDSIDKSVHSAIAHSEELTQSILAKAFRGELVEQDPNDEPAAILLEKIAKKKSTSSK